MKDERPKRIQRKRTRGWKMPEGAVCVTRPSKWCNPRRITQRQTREAGLREFRRWAEPRAALIQQDLRGKDLVSWYPLDQPCYVDVLLEIANRDERPKEGR